MTFLSLGRAPLAARDRRWKNLPSDRSYDLSRWTGSMRDKGEILVGADTDILFTPFDAGGLTLRNRFVMAPMTRNFSPGGIPSPGVADYYRRRAAADVGLIVTEGVGVDHPAALGRESVGGGASPVLHGETALARWREVVAAVHEEGGKIVPQLWHQGVIRAPGTGYHPEAPSARPSGTWGPTEGAMVPPNYLELVRQDTAPLTESEIGDIIAGFARSAANARAVGFDGVALHGAHGYLIDSFFWQQTNRRADGWGGDLPARARFAAEVIRAVRAATAPDFPIVFRFSQWKLQDYDARIAATPAELEALLAPLVDAGVDVLDASTRIFTRPAFEGSDLGLAGWAKKLTGKPTMAVGGVGLDKDLQSSFAQPTVMTDNLALVAERVAKGEFDLVGVGRALLMDAQWVRRMREGQAVNPFRLEAYGSLD
ncbi:NADH:flavin oxidoreductase [Novosphingobium resinovorum]|uniref:NADH:flavin oxidoreductase n=2 Tax=Sphingomonadaceae TaxID=41297 RepID=UPI0022F25818|nr:NADH:flavin oxidoreductase [Novosphingobium resinovorum]GLK45455.1 oxidoreductase [Novosphingobium resinovorum]